MLSSRLNVAFCFLFFAAMMAGCSGSKSLAKKGDQLMEAGLYTDAATFYFNALLRNQNNVDARIGLNQTAQKVLNDKYDVFSKARAMEEHKSALNAYQDAVAYREKVQRLGVKLDAANHYTQDYEEVKGIFMKNLYDKGNDLMADRKFDEANVLFKEIAQLDPNYKDLQELKNIARNEPVYIDGSALFDALNYRQAYYKFDEIYRTDPGYKDVAVLRAECLDLGKYPVAIMPMENASGKKDVEKRVHAFVITELASADNPFLRIVERDNMDVILREQRLSLSGIIDERTASQVGNLLGAKVIITGNVLSYNTTTGKMRVTEKNGYEAYQVKLLNKETDKHYYETRYRPVKYQEYYNRNETTFSFQYKGISLETGEVLFSRIVDKTYDSKVYYGAYSGEVTHLYPAGSNGVLRNSRDKNVLMELMRANRAIKSVDQLSNEAFAAVARDLTADIVNLINKP